MKSLSKILALPILTLSLAGCSGVYLRADSSERATSKYLNKVNHSCTSFIKFLPQDQVFIDSGLEKMGDILEEDLKKQPCYKSSNKKKDIIRSYDARRMILSVSLE